MIIIIRDHKVCYVDRVLTDAYDTIITTPALNHQEYSIRLSGPALSWFILDQFSLFYLYIIQLT